MLISVLKPGASLADALQWAASEFTLVGIDSANLDAELLLMAATGLNRTQLHLHRLEPLTDNQRPAFAGYVQRRANREPLAYIVGQRAFYDLELLVGRGVLIPRPETELLVEQALTWLGRVAKSGLWAADIGTGSGAIAVTLARKVPGLICLGVDISTAALQVARRNIARYHLENQVSLLCSDLLAAVDFRFDLVLANLPYIPDERIPGLQPEITDYEPRQALAGGKQGLDVIARLCSQLLGHLNTPGLVLLEIDAEQGDAVRRMLEDALPDSQVAILRDYAGLDRIAKAEIAPRGK